jgi:sporulation protein YlmC with PRC-barrel domain
MALTITLGSAVQCTDGKGGSVSHIVFNPTTQHVDYLVVHRGLFGGHDHCVPAGRINAADPDQVSLALTVEELKEMPELEYRVPGESFRQRSIPDYCVALDKTTPLRDRNGDLIGHLHGVVLDTEHRVERVLLDKKDDPGIPVDRVTAWNEDGLTVQLAEQIVS